MENLHFRSPEEMREAFADFPEALRNTVVGGRALQPAARLRAAAAARLPAAGGRDLARGLPAHAGLGRAAGRVAEVTEEVRRRFDYELDVICRMGFASYFLIVRDFIAFARGPRHRGGPGPRLGGGLAGGLRAAHHRDRPAGARAHLRALPQPRARDHAGHRHRLRRPAPPRGHRVRARQVRRGQRHPDHHLRHDGGEGRAARRRPGARPAVRRRGPRGAAGARTGWG